MNRSPSPASRGPERSERPLVFKFGGSSVADAGRLLHVAGLVGRQAARAPLVVVVSALAGVTDALVELAHAAGQGDAPGMAPRVEAIRRRHLAVLAELGPGDADGTVACVGALEGVLARLEETADAAAAARVTSEARADEMRAAGDTLAAHLLARALQMQGVEARFVDARSVIRTDARFGQARPDEAALASRAWAELAPLLSDGVVPVVPGFVGATSDGRTTTLGRGGSDYTATLLGAALEAREVHIWTDVDGVLSGDPRTVSAPRPLEVMGFEETVELAHFGARVLHPGAAKHAVSRGLAVRIRSTFTPERPGSLILRERVGPAEIAAVAFKEAVALIKVRSHPSAMPFGFLARVFEILARHRLPVDLVATSHTSTAFTLDETEEIGPAASELGDFAEVSVSRNLATVTVVGRGLMDAPGINARVFEAVGHTPVHLVSQASDVSLSLVVDAGEARDLVRRLHAALVEEGGRTDDEGHTPADGESHR